jgi:hypothetical protein
MIKKPYFSPIYIRIITHDLQEARRLFLNYFRKGFMLFFRRIITHDLQEARRSYASR